EVVWKWFEKRPVWSNAEERLLWRTLQAANQANLDRYFTRAQQIAQKGGASRAYEVGWVENRMDQPKRSILQLERAIKAATDKELREKAAFALLESYIDLGDWQHSEAAFANAKQRLGPSEY